MVVPMLEREDELRCQKRLLALRGAIKRGHRDQRRDENDAPADASHRSITAR